MACLEPSRNAVEVEGVIALTPSDGALFGCGRALVGLAFDAKVHDVVSADGAVIDYDVPGPETDGIPLVAGQTTVQCKIFQVSQNFVSSVSKKSDYSPF